MTVTGTKSSIASPTPSAFQGMQRPASDCRTASAWFLWDLDAADLRRPARVGSACATSLDIALAEFLYCGKVDRNGHGRKARVLPGTGLAAGLMQHPAVHGGDQARFSAKPMNSSGETRPRCGASSAPGPRPESAPVCIFWGW